MLEPYEGKFSRTVLRGERDSNIPDLLDRPDQLIQRNGRILRQGNENKEIEIFNYITEGSFDSYLWQILENKQKFISQVMTEKSPLRSCDDIDEVVLNYAEIKGLAMKNPFMKEKMQVETEINKINLLKANFMDAKERYKREIEKLPIRIEKLTKSIENINLDIETYKNNKPFEFEITLNNTKFYSREKAGQYFMQLKSDLERERNTENMQEIGSYAGFKIGFTSTINISKVYLIGNKTYDKDLGISDTGNMTRIENLASDIEKDLLIYKKRLDEVNQNLKQAKEEINKPFEYDERLNYLLKRKIEIDYNIENNITTENEENQESNEIIDSQNNYQENNSPTEKEYLGKILHRKLYDWAFDILDGKKDYLRLKANGFDDLVLEKIYEDEYSLAHYSTLNGDAMRSPEITFKVQNGSIEPTSYLDDYLGQYNSYEELQENPSLLKDIKDFFNGWLSNIAEHFKTAIEKLKENITIEETTDIENVVVETDIYDEKNMTVEKIRELYPVGTLIKLEHMDGEDLPKGLKGAVKNVDDMGQVHVIWENGSSLALNLKVDKFEVLNKEQNINKEPKIEEYVEEYGEDWEEI